MKFHRYAIPEEYHYIVNAIFGCDAQQRIWANFIMDADGLLEGAWQQDGEGGDGLCFGVFDRCDGCEFYYITPDYYGYTTMDYLSLDIFEKFQEWINEPRAA